MKSVTKSQLVDSIKIGHKNIARYENGAIQDKSIDLLIRIFDEPTSAVDLFKK